MDDLKKRVYDYIMKSGRHWHPYSIRDQEEIAEEFELTLTEASEVLQELAMDEKTGAPFKLA